MHIYTVVRCDGQAQPPKAYRGQDAFKHFLDRILKEKHFINEIFRNPKAIFMTMDDSKCWICEKTYFGDDKNRKVLDHCHLTGRYRGVTHAYCNLQLSIKPGTRPIPVVFHNLRGYDSRLIMQAISETEGNLKCITNNMEKYISFLVGQLRFVDSAQFYSLHSINS